MDIHDKINKRAEMAAITEKLKKIPQKKRIGFNRHLQVFTLVNKWIREKV